MGRLADDADRGEEARVLEIRGNREGAATREAGERLNEVRCAEGGHVDQIGLAEIAVSEAGKSRGEEDTVSGANRRPPFAGWIEGDADPWTEVVVIGTYQTPRSTRIARVEQAQRRSRKNLGLLVELKRLKLILAVDERREDLVAQSQIQGEARSDLPVVLKEQGPVL